MIASQSMHMSTGKETDRERERERGNRKYHHSTLKLTGSYINNGRIYAHARKSEWKKTPYHTSHIMHCQNGNFYYFMPWIFAFPILVYIFPVSI